MISHSPATARTKMPRSFESNFLSQVKRRINGGKQRLGVTEVGALVEVDSVQRQVMFSAKLRSFQDFCARHAKFAVLLTGLGMSVMGPNGDTGQEAQP